VQERIESTAPGRAVITAFIVLALAGAVIMNVPDSEWRARILRTARPVLNAIGLEQSWSMFSPDPRSFALDLRARITYADGGTAEWRVPRGGTGLGDRTLGAYRAYHWQKWMEWARSDARAELWEPTARWVARRYARAGRVPVRVVLVRRFYDIPEPGAERPPWREFAYYTYERREGSR
jgi:hypothetical protein